MKSTKKAFTLVELIVVITILAVLATVAFISLTGYSQDAKNSKVTSDVRTLVSAVEAKMTKDGTLPTTLVDTSTESDIFDDNEAASTLKYWSGTELSKGNYNVGIMNFSKLGQNGDDFNADGKPYGFAAVGTSYQFAGEVFEEDQFKPVLKGNYIETIPDDVDSLFVENGTSTNVLTNTSSSGSTNLY